MYIRKAKSTDANDLKILYFEYLTHFPPVEEQDMNLWEHLLDKFESDENMYLLVMEEDGKVVSSVLETEIDEEIIFDQLWEKPGAIWSMLLASGYLKVAQKRFSRETRRFTYCLELTNWEVEMMFEDMIRGWFGKYPIAGKSRKGDMVRHGFDYIMRQNLSACRNTGESHGLLQYR